MKGFWIFISVLLCLIGACLAPTKALAQRVELFLVIDNPSIQAGGAVIGKLTAKVYGHFGGAASNCNVRIDFEAGTPVLSFPCQYDPNTGVEEYTVCEQKFTHVYTTPGRKRLILYATCGGTGLVTRKQVFINVSQAPTVSPQNTIQSAIRATTAEEIIRAIIRIVYWIVGSLLVLMIMIGGFIILTSAGNPQRAVRGRQIITYAILGFAIMALSRGLIEFLRAMLGITTTT